MFFFLNKYFRQYFKCKLQHKVCFIKKREQARGGGMIVQQKFNSFCGGGGLHTHTDVNTHLTWFRLDIFHTFFILITEKYENIYIYIFIYSKRVFWVGQAG